MTFRILAALALVLGAATAQAEPLEGQWTSLACELRPQDQHVTRDISILADGTWTGAFAFFTGPGCTDPFMTFYASGPWERSEETSAVSDAEAVNFTIAEAEIETLHDGAAGFLSSGPCGAAAWAPGVRQAITETGCAPIGLGFPVTEHEIVLVRDDLLFFGARPNDGSGLSTPATRPTALQVPLVRAN